MKDEMKDEVIGEIKAKPVGAKNDDSEDDDLSGWNDWQSLKFLKY